MQDLAEPTISLTTRAGGRSFELVVSSIVTIDARRLGGTVVQLQGGDGHPVVLVVDESPEVIYERIAAATLENN
jgi:hypothetical protein